MRHSLRLAICLFLFTVSSQFALAETTLFRQVHVFDGTEDLGELDVLITDGKIAQIEKEIERPDDSILVEGKGKTLFPGLIDAHTHANSRGDLEQALLFGVTTECDMMGNPADAKVRRREQATGRAFDRADVFAAGIAVTVKGGHGTQYAPVPSLESAEKAQEFVDARLAEGSDYIKIVYGGKPVMTKEMLKASIDATHARGKLAVAHIDICQQAMDAIESGIDGLVHLCGDDLFDEDDVKLAKEKGAFIVPTTAILQGCSAQNSTDALLEDVHLKPLIGPWTRKNLGIAFRIGEDRLDYPKLKKNIAAMHRGGVPILAGTDAPNPSTHHGVSLHHELELLVACGLDPQDALAGATALVADSFKFKDRGRIRVGQRADLLLVNGNPLEDIKHTRRIAGVWKGGKVFDRRPIIGGIANSNQKMREELDAPVRLVSDFEEGLDSKFGKGWSEQTGGDGEVALTLVKDAARGSMQSVRISGEIKEQGHAGTSLTPGDHRFYPVDLRAHKRISFWAKGKPATYSVRVFAHGLPRMNGNQPFKTTEEWKQFTFDFKDFNGWTGKSVISVFVGSEVPGKFEFFLDEVELKK